MLKPENKPYNVILITDPNSDPDDLVSYLILKQLMVQGEINLKAAVITLGDRALRLRRTKFAAAVWQRLAVNIPVVCGSDYPEMGKINSHYCENEWADKLEKEGFADNKNVEDVIRPALQQSADQSVVILINAQMNDIASFLQKESNQLLFEQKVLKVVLMGACCQGEDGIYRPSAKSFNNKVCMSGAEILFQYLQQKRIPLILVPKETVYQVKVGKDFYVKLKNAGNIISKVLYSCSRQCMENLWNEVKNGQVSHFDLKRYIKVFIGSDYWACSKTITKESTFEEVWDKVKYFSLYDALAALAVSEREFLAGGRYEKLDEAKEVYIAQINNPEIICGKLYTMCEKTLTNMKEE